MNQNEANEAALLKEVAILNKYSKVYVVSGANSTYQRVRWEVEYLTRQDNTLNALQADDLITRVMNELTDAVLEMLGYAKCNGALVKLAHTLAAWNLLNPQLYDRIGAHLAHFEKHSTHAPDLLAEFATTWQALCLLNPMKQQLTEMHTVFVEASLPQAAAALRFVEATQEMVKAVTELLRPNLSTVEFDTAKQNAMKAIKNIADGVDYIPEY